ncbi:unnamed protein product [Lota lota]
MKRGAAATRQAARRRQDDRALFNVKATNWTVSPLQARGVTRCSNYMHRGLKCSPAERRGFGRGSARGPRDPALSAPNGSAR